MKKKKSKKKHRSKGRGSGSATPSMTSMLRDLLAGKRAELPADADSALRLRWQAANLLDEAEGAPGPRAAELAREALELDPEYGEAYILLAEQTAETPEEARDLYEQAVRVSKSAMDRELAEDGAKEFDKLEESRTHLRALLGFGRASWLTGDTRQAIASLEEILRLSPHDPVRARLHLFNYLALEGTMEALGELLRRYWEETLAHWLYSRALWAFRRWGEGRKSCAVLLAAVGRAPRVPDFLLGRKRVPETTRMSFRYGSNDEAAAYAAFAEEAWQETPGALEWLERNLPKADTRAGAVYQLRIVLLGSQPRIWRRLLVEGNTTLLELHDIIQYAMGWNDEHLHHFNIGGVLYDPDPHNRGGFGPPPLDESKARLRSVLPFAKTRGTYEYDFGDSWNHEILVERILDPDPDVVYPVCIAGKRQGPPEDSGGVWRYNEIVEIIRDPEDPEYEDAIDWLGEDFDPDDLDLDTINGWLAGLP